MVELLVTIVLAGIIFAAMVPFFANALKRPPATTLRVDATNIAQDRIEQIRLLDYADITAPKPELLAEPTCDTPFGDGRFGPTYTLVGETQPYTVDLRGRRPPRRRHDVPQKFVTVQREPGGDGYVTTAHTIIQEPGGGQPRR